MGILTNLISWSFFVGQVLGFAASRAWQLVKVCRLDKRRPLPDGKRRSKWRAVSVDPRWMAGAIAVAFLGWSVLQTNANANENERIAGEAAATSQRTNDCFGRLIEAIVDSRKVTAANDRIGADSDRLSKEERQLLVDLARYQSEWLGRILDPPAEVKALEPGSPVRERYNLDVTRGFFNRAGEANRRVEAIHREQDANLASQPEERPALPDPECGAG